MQFMVRDDELHCFANMRSSDVWLGVPYDWVNFSAISAYILLCLKMLDIKFDHVSLGNLYFYAASQHLYAENYENARRISEEPTQLFTVKDLNLDEFTFPGAFTAHLKAIADNNPSRALGTWLLETTTT
jgi:thymidylate synthase